MPLTVDFKVVESLLCEGITSNCYPFTYSISLVATKGLLKLSDSGAAKAEIEVEGTVNQINAALS